MKKAELEKLQGARLASDMRKTPAPGRFAQGSAAPADRRTQRKLDRERGLVPFAVKLDGELVNRIRAAAAERSVDLAELVGDFLRKGLEAKT